MFLYKVHGGTIEPLLVIRIIGRIQARTEPLSNTQVDTITIGSSTGNYYHTKSDSMARTDIWIFMRSASCSLGNFFPRKMDMYLST